MTKIIQLFIISALFLIVTKTDLAAREVSGSLSAGEGSSFVPSRGSSFSIISDLTSGIYDGSFNILIRSGGKIIYQEKNQLDDLYLVFNEPIDDGDVIKLDIVKGVFVFKMSHMDTLPDVIIDAIKKQAPRAYKQLKPLHKPYKKKPVKQKVMPKEEPRVIKRHIEPENYTPKKEPEVVMPKLQPIERKKEVGFFDSLSEKIGKLVSEKDEIISAKPVPKDIAKPISDENIIKPTTQKSGIDNLSSSIDSVNKKIASVIKSQGKAINSSVTRSGIEDVAQSSKIDTPKTSTSGIKSLPTAETFPLDFDPSKSPAGFKSSIPKSQSKIESFSTAMRPSMQETKTGIFQTQISTSAVQKPKFSTYTPEPEVIVKKIKVQEKISEPILEEILKVEPGVVAQEVVKEISEPVMIKAPYVKREESKDRIVITKTLATQKKEEVQKDEPRVISRHVEPQEYKDEQKQVPQRMSDRVVGNGYGMGTQGKIKVKAYSNNRAVSAWVEVFKAGTKQRVKTFYTGKGGSLKDIKLPPGTYVIKATYRTANSKRKKTVGRVVLEEGGSINKSISFDDGSITVNARKLGEPIYAKVEVYKSGSKRRVAYEFTSKLSGVAKLSLGSGKYDIVVKDHSNVRRFDAVSVRGGKSKVLNADF